MKAKYYQRISPNFRYTKIFLFKQLNFNNSGNMKKFLSFPLNKFSSNNKYITQFKIDENLDYFSKRLFSKNKIEYNDLCNEKKNSILISSPNKNKNIKVICSKILKNNKQLKKIDFNVNDLPDKLNSNFDLNINPYFSNKKRKIILSPNINKSNKTINMDEKDENNVINEINKNLNKNDNSLNKRKEFSNDKFHKIKFPFIYTNINRKNYYSLTLNNEKEKNINNKLNIEEQKNVDKKDIKRDIFKNINYCFDNKKNHLKIKSIYDSKNLKVEDENDNIESKLFINTKIPKMSERNSFIKHDFKKINADKLLSDKEISKLKEKEKYIIYEQNKKIIDKNKIYDPMKYGAANIPNLCLDKGFQELKKFEKTILNLKKIETDMPIFIKTKQNN